MTIKLTKLTCILSSLLVCVNFSLAQTNKELEFNVIKPKIEITLKPGYKWLYQNVSHPIEVIISDTVKPYTLKLAGGTISQTDTGTFITPEVAEQVILNVYEENNGKETLVGSKKFLVLPEPIPYLRDKPTDNMLPDILLMSGKLTGVTTLSGKKLSLKVRSFTVSYRNENRGFDEVKVIGDELPGNVCKKMLKLPNGSLIYFDSIMIELLPGYDAIIQPYRITMEVNNSKDVIKMGAGNSD